jgi:hypothetical protein
MNIEKTLQKAERFLADGKNAEAAAELDRVLEVLREADPMPNFDRIRIATRFYLARARAGDAADMLGEAEWAWQYFVDFVGKKGDDALWALAVLAEIRQLDGDREGALRDARDLWQSARESDMLFPEDVERAAQLTAVRLESLGEVAEAGHVRGEGRKAAQEARKGS